MAKPKLIDTWHFEHLGLDSEGLASGVDSEKLSTDQKSEVKVYLDKEFGISSKPPHPVKEISFIVESDYPKFKFVGPNIETLRQMAKAEMDKFHAIKWERYIEVIIHPSYGGGVGFSLDTKDIHKGIAHDGAEILKRYEYNRGYYYYPWPENYRTKDGKVVACIPATDKNELALKEYKARIEALRTILADSVKPENIFKTLDNLASNAFLPPPIKELDDEDL